ncbi:polysaccharide deacetylase family protein [Streptomyces sp. BI20]|uniref:polysaccharide deacetylase family protein n=1 Tax=Streptomyces sp. BI20 TaxID=3403460 RepID=UPI003C7490BA
MTAETLPAGLPGPRPARPPGAVPWVLMYHSVTAIASPDQDPYGITVTPEVLDAQLRRLVGQGLRGVSMGELWAARAAGRAAGLVGLTFDDGYRDFLEHALPLLARHRCTATLFVLPGRLGTDNAWDPLGPRKPLLDADEVREAAAAGTEIGSHGMLHRHLTGLPDAELTAELVDSRAALTELTGRAPEGFCYPYGSLDRRVLEATRAAGYAWAVGIDPGPLAGDPHAIARTHVSQADGPARLLVKQARHRARELRRGVFGR